MPAKNESLKTIDVCFTCSDHSESILGVDFSKLNTTFNVNLDDTVENKSVDAGESCTGVYSGGFNSQSIQGLSLNDRILELEDSIIFIKQKLELHLQNKNQTYESLKESREICDQNTFSEK
jgi:hypothetical protein